MVIPGLITTGSIRKRGGPPGFLGGEGGHAGGGQRGPLSRRPHPPGVKHLEELMAARQAGYEAGVCFIVQMEGMARVEPNDRTHPEFGDALRRAARAGVEVLALECRVEPGGLWAERSIPVER